MIYYKNKKSTIYFRPGLVRLVHKWAPLRMFHVEQLKPFWNHKSNVNALHFQEIKGRLKVVNKKVVNIWAGWGCISFSASSV